MKKLETCCLHTTGSEEFQKQILKHKICSQFTKKYQFNNSDLQNTFGNEFVPKVNSCYTNIFTSVFVR